jgi:hypothetical protein
VQNEGTGLLITGTREWQDYQVSARLRPHLAERAGIACRVQGMRRWYGLMVGRDGVARLVKCFEQEQVLAEAAFQWEFGQEIEMSLSMRGRSLEGTVDGAVVLRATDACLNGGGIAFVVTEGRLDSDEIRVTPV